MPLSLSFKLLVISFNIELFILTYYLHCAGKIESGLPTISLPPFSVQVGNQTYTFLDMCAHYGSGLVILPLIAVLANVAIAKAFGIDYLSILNHK